MIDRGFLDEDDQVELLDGLLLASRRSCIHTLPIGQGRSEQTVARRDVALQDLTPITRAEEIGRRVWRQLVARYPNVPFPITLPPPAEL